MRLIKASSSSGQMVSIKQIKAARLFLDWSQRDLAREAGLSLPTIQRMEKFGVGRSSVDNVQKLIETFEAAGIEFIDENGGGAGVRFHSK